MIRVVLPANLRALARVGPELALELRRLRPTLPVVLMSGFFGPDLKARAESVQARAMLLKPLQVAQLASCLAALFAQRSGVEVAGAAEAVGA